MLNVALLGFGRIGQMHAKNINDHKNLKLYYVYEKMHNLSQKARKLYNCKIENNSGLMLGPLIVDQKFKGRGIGKELVNKSIGVINEKNIDFIILIGEFDYYGQFGFERNANVYFSLNVRKEKILLKKLSEKNNTLSGKIELY